MGNRRPGFVVFITVFLATLTWAHGPDPKPLQMAFIDTDAVPFKWAENGKRIGPIIDIMAEAARRADLAVELVPLPAKRIDAYLADGRIDGAFGLSRKASRERSALFLDPPIALLDAHLFVIRGKEFPFAGIEDLYGKKIGLVRGLVFGAAFDAAVRGNRFSIENANTYDSLLKMLLRRRVDAVASPVPVLIYHIQKMGLSERVVALARPLRPDFGLHVVVSRAASIFQQPGRIQRLETALKNMAQDGVFESIYQNYGYSYRPRH